VTSVIGWRAAIGSLAALPLAAFLVMRRSLPPDPGRGTLRGVGLRRSAPGLLRNRGLVGAMLTGPGLFFVFVGTFSFVSFRLQRAPFGLSDRQVGLVFLLWLLGFVGPLTGRLAERVGWRPVALASVVVGLVAVAVSIPSTLPTLLLSLGLLSMAMFGGVTGAQLGVAGSTELDRGVASAFYFTAFYLSAALAGYLPGRAWEAYGWTGIVVTDAAVLVCCGALALAAFGPRAVLRPAGAVR
jgi:YNFM family putative membrane transporter